MNKDFMNSAFEEALKAFNSQEVPIGAVVVKNNKVIARSFNKKESSNCCIAHAEINAIVEASKVLNNWRLDDCDIYVTLDPCPMCASAIKQARIKNVYSACSNSDSNNFNIISSIFQKDMVNPQVNYVSNIDSQSSKKILSDFFEQKRK